MKIVFRVDASFQIGSGHVMRCITLAKSLRERGGICHFISREHQGNMLEFIRRSGFEATALPTGRKASTDQEADKPVLAHSEWLGTHWQTDAQQTIDATVGEIVDWLIVDHYALDFRWETQLRRHVNRIMVIDDLADRNHDCDLLLDQNLVADLENRYNANVPPSCTRLLGPEYALLQTEYTELHPRTPPRLGPVKRILIFFGGVDQHNLTGLVLSAFLMLQRKDIALDIVINHGSPNAEAIRGQAKEHAHINVHDILPSLAPLMLKADFAIGAGGATSWERCCLGLPSLVITVADNQKPIAAALEQLELVRWIGHFDAVTEQSIAQALHGAVENTELEKWSQACMTLIDAKGVERIVSIMSLDMNTPLNARLARLSDEALLVNLYNAAAELESAFNPVKNPKETARQWFYNRLRSPEDNRVYVVEAEAGMLIGIVIFECNRDEWDIRYTIAPEALGKNLCNRILQVAVLELRRIVQEALVFRPLKVSNHMSQKAGSEKEILCHTESSRLTISVCTDAMSWINESLPELILRWLEAGYTCCWSHEARSLPGGDLCFYLSYGRIVRPEVLSKYRNNLVVHASELPKGRGWSPTSWMILEGARHIPVTLLEAVEEVDAGPIYEQLWFDLERTDISHDWRRKLSIATSELVNNFVADYPENTVRRRCQTGEATYYPKRRPVDSRLNVNQTIAQQFDLLRIADNEQYPAFFEIDGHEFVLKIYRRKSIIH